MDNLIVKGKVVQILPPQSGESSNGSWKKQEFVIETDGNYPKKICISGFNDTADLVGKLSTGENVDVYVNIESREYNSRWYTDIKAWRIDPSNVTSTNKEGHQVPAADALQESNGDDLPF